MKKLLSIVLIFFFLSCTTRSQERTTSLSVSPIVEQTRENAAIIDALTSFLQTKNDNPSSNKYWVAEDFLSFIYPYKALYLIESSKLGENFYQPSLMEILPTTNRHQKIIKLAYIGHDTKTHQSFIRTIFNFIAQVTPSGIQFSSYTDYITANWEVIEFPHIKYHISNRKEVNREQINAQLEEMASLVDFFDCAPLHITYYSCIDAVELFHIKGFDYTPEMYLSKNGGLAEAGHIVYSANNSEIYTHEIVHLYTHAYLDKIPPSIDEGLATYLGGSGGHPFEWHKTNFKKHLKATSRDINYLEILQNPYLQDYIDRETPLPYITAALLCEYVIERQGKNYFFESIRNLEHSGDLTELLKAWKIDVNNLDCIMGL